jgi:uncharacterized protein (TIGR03437 family)
VSQSSLNFFHQVGSPAPGSQTVTVSTATPTSVNVAVSTSQGGTWLFASPSGIPVPAPFTLTVIALPTGLTAGTYNGTITLSATGASNVTIQVTLVVSTSPLLTASPTALTFTHALSSATPPPAQTIAVSTTASAPIAFSAAATVQIGTQWLAVTPTSGSTPSTLTVTVNPAGLVAGTYNGTISIASAGAANSPLQIPVTMQIADLRLSVSPAALAFDYQPGGALPVDQVISVTSTGGSVAFTAAAATTAGGNWLAISATSGTTNQNLTVSVNPVGLTQGTYTGSITITSPGVANSPQIVAVTLTVSPDQLAARPSAVTFTHQVGGTAPPSQLVLVTNVSSPVAVSVATNGGAWLTVSTAAASTPFGVLVNVNPQGLNPGIYNGNVVLTALTPNSPLSVPVTLVVTAAATLRVSANQLLFFAQVGGSNPAAQSFNVTSTGAAQAFNATASTASGGAWLSVSPATGITDASVSVSVNAATLAPGTYTGTVTVVSTQAGSSPINIPVRLTVSNSPLLVVPSGPLTFSFSAGGQLPPNQSIAVASTGASINFTAAASTAIAINWLAVAPNGPVPTPQNLTVGVNTFGLVPGRYTGILRIAADGIPNSPQYVPVILDVSQNIPLTLNPAAPVNFVHTIGQPAPGARGVQLTSAAPLNFTVTAQTTDGRNWLRVTPTTGLTNQELSITVVPEGLERGLYGGTITITAPQASNTPQLIPVTLEVRAPAANLVLSRDTLTFAARLNTPAPASQQVQITSSGDALPFSVTSSTTSGGAWLQVSGSSASTPATLTVGVNPAGLVRGTYTGTINIVSASAANSPRTIAVTLMVEGAQPVVNTVVHAASFQPTAAVPGLLVTLTGTDLGPTPAQTLRLNAQGSVDTTLGGVRVLFDNIPAPLLFVSAGQINCVVPYGLAGRARTSVLVENQGSPSNRLELNIADANPGIFLLNAAGQGAIVNQIGTINGVAAPAPRGSVIIIYATGEGATAPAGVDGGVSGVNTPLKQPILPTRVRIGGIEAEVQYAGSAPSLVAGVLQINVVIPLNSPVGPAVPIQISVGAFNSPPGVTVAVQ